MTFDAEILSEEAFEHLVDFGKENYAIKALEFDDDALQFTSELGCEDPMIEIVQVVLRALDNENLDSITFSGNGMDENCLRAIATHF